MPAEALHFENKKGNFHDLRLSLKSLKERSLIVMEIIKDPANKRLYEILKSYPETLSKWFWLMCGEKFQKENVEKVMKSLEI
jgi:hypothetical protein